MERVKQAAQKATQSGPRVVFVGDGEIPQTIRDLFPGTEFIRPADMEERTRTRTTGDSRRAEALASILVALTGGAPKPEPEPTPEPAHTRRSTDDPILDSMKPMAFAELDKLAAEHGLSFSGEEREALFALSKVFDPDTAKAAARTACAVFNKENLQ